MKLVQYSLVAAFVCAAGLYAQPLARAADKTDSTKPAARERVRDRLKQIAEELNLTAEQKEKLRPAIKAEAEKLKAVRDDTSLSRQERMEKFRTIREEFDAKMKQVLTPEQYQKWQAKREQLREEVRKRARR